MKGKARQRRESHIKRFILTTHNKTKARWEVVKGVDLSGTSRSIHRLHSSQHFQGRHPRIMCWRRVQKMGNLVLLTSSFDTKTQYEKVFLIPQMQQPIHLKDAIELLIHKGKLRQQTSLCRNSSPRQMKPKSLQISNNTLAIVVHNEEEIPQGLPFLMSITRWIPLDMCVNNYAFSSWENSVANLVVSNRYYNINLSNIRSVKRKLKDMTTKNTYRVIISTKASWPFISFYDE